MITKEHLDRWLKGNAEAISFIIAMHDVAEIWDDLIDQDNEIDPERINKAFYLTLIQIPRNGFYQRNFNLLSPIVESAILDWHTANELEKRGGEDDLHTAYGLRCASQSLTVLSARIIGGHEWAKDVNLEIRSLGDTWADYAAEHGAS